MRHLLEGDGARRGDLFSYVCFDREGCRESIELGQRDDYAFDGVDLPKCPGAPADRQRVSARLSYRKQPVGGHPVHIVELGDIDQRNALWSWTLRCRCRSA
jgi:hypothetical protein